MSSSSKQPKLSMETLQRTISDISLQVLASQETKNEDTVNPNGHGHHQLPPISEVEEAKCECCGMSEECTQEYVNRVRSRFSGKLICGLCAEAVAGEMEKNGGLKEEALEEHMSACVRFNRIGRTHPVLYQAQAMREILKKSKSSSGRRAKGLGKVGGGGGLARSSSCIPAITREINHHGADN